MPKTNVSNPTSSSSKQWQPLTSEFQLEKPVPKMHEQKDVPFYVPEKKRRMNPKNVVDNDFIITVYLPHQQQQNQQNTQSMSSPASTSSTKASNLFKVYSYRSTEMPSELQQTTSSLLKNTLSNSNASSSQSDFDSRDVPSPTVSPTQEVIANERSVRSTEHPKAKKLKRDKRHSLDFIMHNQNQDIDKRFNPFS